jgi:hypothetical protein
MVDSARRASLTGAAKGSPRAIRNGSANRPPPAKRVGARVRRPQPFGRRCPPTFCWRLKAGTPSLIVTSRRAWLAVSARALSRGSVSPWSANLDRLPARGRAGSGSSRGVSDTRREGLPVTGLQRSPSFPPEWGGRHRPTHSAKPRPGCGLLRRGFAAQAALGRGRAPQRGVARELPRPVSCRRLNPGASRLCSDGGHSGGQGWESVASGADTKRDLLPVTNTVAETTAKCGRIRWFRLA